MSCLIAHQEVFGGLCEYKKGLFFSEIVETPVVKEVRLRSIYLCTEMCRLIQKKITTPSIATFLQTPPNTIFLLFNE